MTADSLPRLTLILGGARSGKSVHAERLIASARPAPWIYIATAQAFDDEMRTRIAHHKARRGTGWHTHEAPLALAETLRRQPPGAAILVDCLTLWLGNTLLAQRDIDAAAADLCAALAAVSGPCVLVSNEVGLGIVPETALAREFRDRAGRLHQALAAEADRVLLMVAGLPMTVKG
ncbi:MAG: bifunctional adenosylcobinamide kinase/adenosylcobinamide-phosphate guanylyltransferase [Hyphomicrobiaceae bacterium]